MAKAKKFELKSSAPILDGKDEEMLAPIDEGTRDAKAGRTAPAEEVRKRLPKWITAPLHSPPTTNVGAPEAPTLVVGGEGRGAGNPLGKPLPGSSARGVASSR